MGDFSDSTSPGGGAILLLSPHYNSNNSSSSSSSNNNNNININNNQSPGERSSTPLNFEYWCGDVELSQGDIDEINLAAFVTAAAANHPHNSNNNTNTSNITATTSTVEEEDAAAATTGNNKRGRDTHDSISIDSSSVSRTNVPTATAAPTVSRRKKKPKGFPKRPLSGYNIFFKQERVNVLQEHNNQNSMIPTLEGGGEASERSNVSFQDLGKIIGKRWKALTEDERKKYEYLAQQDSVRYRTDMEVFNENKRMRNEEKNKEAITGCTEEKKESPPISWSTTVLSGPPEIKPLFHQSAHQPLQARLPGQGNPPQLLRMGPPASFPSYAQHQQHERQQHAQGFVNASSLATNTTNDPSMDYPIPPGTELFLADPQGRERKFKVQYKFYTMTRHAAEAYMELLSTSAAATPYGFTDHPPPPGGGGNSRYVSTVTRC